MLSVISFTYFLTLASVVKQDYTFSLVQNAKVKFPLLLIQTHREKSPFLLNDIIGHIRSCDYKLHNSRFSGKFKVTMERTIVNENSLSSKRVNCVSNHNILISIPYFVTKMILMSCFLKENLN